MGESTKADYAVDKPVQALNAKINGLKFDVWKRTAQSVIKLRHAGISDILEGRPCPEPELISPRSSSGRSEPSRAVTRSQADDERTLSPRKHPWLTQQTMNSRTQGVFPWTRRICYHHRQDILHSQPQHQFFGPQMTTSRIWKTSSTGTATTVFCSTSCSGAHRELRPAFFYSSSRNEVNLRMGRLLGMVWLEKIKIIPANVDVYSNDN